MRDEKLILIVEDDAQISQFIHVSLHAAGFKSNQVKTLSAALSALEDKKPSLVLLDLGLPDGEGLDFIRVCREHSDIPIIVLSARQSEQDKVACLNAGADDYLSKPFGVDELHARINVAIRHTEKMHLRDDFYQLGALTIDRAQGEIKLKGQTVHLSPIEYKLIMLLATRPGKVFSHQQLLSAIWGAEYINDTHYLRIHMGRLRAKIESEPANPIYLLTELGIGYRLSNSLCD